MQELLLAVARGLVEDKDAVKVTVDAPREDGTIVYHLSVAEGDMGRYITIRFRQRCCKKRCILFSRYGVLVRKHILFLLWY